MLITWFELCLLCIWIYTNVSQNIHTEQCSLAKLLATFKQVICIPACLCLLQCFYTVFLSVWFSWCCRPLVFGQGQGFHTILRTFSVKAEHNSSDYCYLLILCLEKHVEGTLHFCDLLHLQWVEMGPSFLFFFFSTPATQSLVFFSTDFK